MTVGEVKLFVRTLETEARALGIRKVPEFESASGLEKVFSPLLPLCLVIPKCFQSGHSA